MTEETTREEGRPCACGRPGAPDTEALSLCSEHRDYWDASAALGRGTSRVREAENDDGADQRGPS